MFPQITIRAWLEVGSRKGELGSIHRMHFVMNANGTGHIDNWGPIQWGDSGRGVLHQAPLCRRGLVWRLRALHAEPHGEYDHVWRPEDFRDSQGADALLGDVVYVRRICSKHFPYDDFSHPQDTVNQLGIRC